MADSKWENSKLAAASSSEDAQGRITGQNLGAFGDRIVLSCGFPGTVAATVQPKAKSMPNQAARAQGIRPTPTKECSRLRSVRDFRPNRDG